MSAYRSVHAPYDTPYTYITVFNAPYPNTHLIGSLQAILPATSVKLQNILQNNKKLFHPDSRPVEGRMSISPPNYHVIQAIIYYV